MKTQLALFIGSFLLVSTSTYAKTNISADEIAELPVLESVKTVVEMPHPMLAVQPIGVVDFKFASCGVFDFKAETIIVGRVMIVKLVIPKDAVECFGPKIERDYSVQISSDMDPRAVVTVLNPVRATVKK